MSVSDDLKTRDQYAPGSREKHQELHEQREGKAHPEKRLAQEIDPGLVDDLKQFVIETAKEREKKARYKIEVTFSSQRTPNGFPDGNAAVICVYASGSRLHGGGDELALWCEQRDPGAGKLAKFDPSRLRPSRGKKLGCGRVIHPESVITKHVPSGGGTTSKRLAICPHCERVWDVRHLTEEIYGRWSTPKLAMKLAGLWRSAGSNADIYVKYHHTDIRYQMMERDHGTETARRLRGAVIYPLQRILADTSTGAALEARFRALLSS